MRLFKLSAASGKQDTTKHFEIPKLLVAFDTETTGLNQGRDDEPVSYGLVAYRNGQKIDSHHFIVDASTKSTKGDYERKVDPDTGAVSIGKYRAGSQEIHGWSPDTLSQSRMMGIPVSDKHGNLLAPALHPAVGIHRFLNILGHYQKQGAVFLGHNLEYDYDMLGRTQKRYAGGHVGTDGRLAGGLPTTAAGFDIDRARKRTIDTMWHDVAMTPTITDESDPRYVARAGGRANAGRSLPNCTRAYGIPESNHSAEDDARSSAELFFKQVERNRARQGML